MPRTRTNKKLDIGAIKTFAGDTPPSGFLVCDGSIVSRTTYARLFAEIGTSWGQGDGSTTFHLPDLRGRFLRGRDAGAGRDPGGRIASNTGGATGDNVGSVQGDSTKNPGFGGSADAVGNHQHYVHTADTPNNVPTNSTYPLAGGIQGLAGFRYSTSAATHSPSSGSGGHSHGVSISGGDSETRALNANVNYIIKAL